MTITTLHPTSQSKSLLKKAIDRRTSAIRRSWDKAQMAERAEAGAHRTRRLARLLFGNEFANRQDNPSGR